MKPTLHASLHNIERMHDHGRHGAGCEAGDGLDGGGRETRMAAVLGHQLPGFCNQKLALLPQFTLCSCGFV
jgi:hypothetical protein